MPEDDARHPASSSSSSSSTARRSSTNAASSSSPSSSTSASSASAAPEFVFHAGQDASQEKFFAHGQDGLHTGSSIKAELEPSEQPPSASSPSPSAPPSSSDKADYFAKLGGGHRLNGRRTTPTPTTTSATAAVVPTGLSLTSEGNTAAATTAATGVAARPGTVVETQGQWDYVYSVDAKGTRKLMRRLPTKKKTVDEGGDTFKPFAGAGHSLK